MGLQNHSDAYGWISISLHWVMAVLIIGLFFLGQYMVDLDYYDPWYQKAPDLHRSLGVIVALLLVLRLIWRLCQPQPDAIGSPWEHRIAKWLHRFFYLLTGAIVISGYLISTADGHSLSVFGLLDLPAILYGLENQEDIAGEIHEWLTSLLMLLVALHALAALKHHFINRDATLRRMLGITQKTSPTNPRSQS